jgi:hypothetical protein
VPPNSLSRSPTVTNIGIEQRIPCLSGPSTRLGSWAWLDQRETGWSDEANIARFGHVSERTPDQVFLHHCDVRISHGDGLLRRCSFWSRSCTQVRLNSDYRAPTQLPCKLREGVYDLFNSVFV